MKTPLLDSISGPGDLRGLSYSQLDELAGEIRGVMVETTSECGGHLAPSLGVVELTIAIHRVFDSPRDRIIWDVGHQAYAHKLLTGRREGFRTLRRLHGLSGFPRREESPHDVNNPGHASTSISYGLGLAMARDLNGEDYNVVAVIGDGSLSGGMAFEALNQAGHLHKDLIIILNDNGMSISRNVGAMSAYLSQLRLNPRYMRMKGEIKEIVESVPFVGAPTDRLIHSFKERLKNFLIPEFIFEELGIQYVGIVDGHDIEGMERDLRLAEMAQGPILIHVITSKGKGYPPAERDPDVFHGIGPFDIESGEAASEGNPSFTTVFGRVLCDMARSEPKLVAITAAMKLGTGLDDFARLFPRRFIDVGIAEQHAVGLAAGLALGGYRPVVSIYSTFLQRAFDQLVQEVCLQNLPVIFALDRAGLVGEDGGTHHGAFDLSYLRMLPNITIMAPSDQAELRDMMWAALEIDGPVAIRYPRGSGALKKIDSMHKPLKLGKAITIKRGKDISIIAVGRMVGIALEAAVLLSKEGIKAEVVNVRFVKPIDEESIKDRARKVKLLVTLEENALKGGFGEGIGCLLKASGIECGFLPLGLPDRFVGHGKVPELLASEHLDAQSISQRIISVLDTES
ncbi:MAG: 1-deoxy-D-xylulose-5-phosphate synthase [Actinobacteria bacterium RBG_19FT_COMBO_54_7]|uniref:1-deoxy-D-xylulose-5-phosphate synthase n=1 Tax=Candidatus Solincola sediminis TaxID=1797199 RepID=A0A1F2WTN4_9ACTN|nr:MAG: 1-deoxy-D-xylulose-5-phosphate synthase [Candidatus Solincola sediminis]OFW67589.1 MAG: 1-deoxy-D-xylulose-5-phosphate synthase [Actinobacteria bacterium RBG_19FT_COMBO_54_7]